MGQVDRRALAEKAANAHNRIDDHAKVLESHGNVQKKHSAALLGAGKELILLRGRCTELETRLNDLLDAHANTVSAVDRLRTFKGAIKVLIGLGKRLI